MFYGYCCRNVHISYGVVVLIFEQSVVVSVVVDGGQCFVGVIVVKLLLVGDVVIGRRKYVIDVEVY